MLQPVHAQPQSSFATEVSLANRPRRVGAWKEYEQHAQRDLRPFLEGQLCSRLSAVESRLYVIGVGPVGALICPLKLTKRFSWRSATFSSSTLSVTRNCSSLTRASSYKR